MKELKEILTTGRIEGKEEYELFLEAAEVFADDYADMVYEDARIKFEGGYAEITVYEGYFNQKIRFYDNQDEEKFRFEDIEEKSDLE